VAQHHDDPWARGREDAALNAPSTLLPSVSVRGLPIPAYRSPDVMIIEEKQPQRRALPQTPDPARTSSKRQAAFAASPPPPSTTAPLAARQRSAAYNDFSPPPTESSLSSPPYSASSAAAQSQTSYTTASTGRPRKGRGLAQPQPAYYPPPQQSAPQPVRSSQPPLHTLSQPSLGSITPNPLLFHNGPSQPEPHTGVTPNLLLLPDSQYARSQPAGMLGHIYQTTAPPVAKSPGLPLSRFSRFPVGLTCNLPEPVRCAEEKHDFETHYGTGGIIISVICFPVGLTALL
jgi:hypothetical protein